MGCVNLCQNSKFLGKYKTRRRYQFDNTKRCTKCDIFIRWDGVRCPCCNNILSSRPRESRNRMVQQIKRGVKRI